MDAQVEGERLKATLAGLILSFLVVSVIPSQVLPVLEEKVRRLLVVACVDFYYSPPGM